MKIYTPAETREGGYTWDGMAAVDMEMAQVLYRSGASVYRLYEDGTESLVEESDRLEDHPGMFGVEYQDLTAAVAFGLENQKPVPGELRLTTEIGDLVARVYGGESGVYDGIVVDLEKPDGTSGQIALAEVVGGDAAQDYPTRCHVFTYDGNESDVTSRTDVDINGEEMQYPPRETRIQDAPDPDSLRTGRFRVQLVHEGEHYGADGSLIYGDTVGKGYPYIGQTINDCQIYGHGLPLVEFYDMAQDPAKFPAGQFISRYYMSTLLGMDDPQGGIGAMRKEER